MSSLQKRKVTKREKWRTEVFHSCTQKMVNQDSSAYCLYCRRKGGEGGVCTFENCPIK